MFEIGPLCHCDECESRRKKAENRLAKLAIVSFFVLFLAYEIFSAIVR